MGDIGGGWVDIDVAFAACYVVQYGDSAQVGRFWPSVRPEGTKKAALPKTGKQRRLTGTFSGPFRGGLS
ncbi:MAG: hypothetical protein ACYTBJ_14165 [Planctomycetota bacterium]